jgi:excisionase family DNA binding protein
MIEYPDYIDAETLAQHLSVSPSYIRKLARNRKIPSYPLGRKCRRFRLEEVKESMSRLRLAEFSEEERRYARRFRR